MLPHPSGPGQGVPVPALSSALGIGKKTHGEPWKKNYSQLDNRVGKQYDQHNLTAVTLLNI